MTEESTEPTTDAPADEQETPQTDTVQEVDYKAEAEKWKALARKHEDQSKSNATKAQELDELTATSAKEREELASQLDALKGESEKSNVALQRLEIALDNAPEGMSIAQVRKLAKRLQGSTPEELAEDAKELFGDYAPSVTPRRGPQEKLRGGAAPDSEPERTPQQLADAVLKKARGF